MQINSKKFQAILFAEFMSQLNYKSDIGATMEETDLVKDLGIHISSDLHFR